MKGSTYTRESTVTEVWWLFCSQDGDTCQHSRSKGFTVWFVCVRKNKFWKKFYQSYGKNYQNKWQRP